MSNSTSYGILEDFISLFYPRYCRGCYKSLVKGEDLVCTDCLLEMPKSHYHLYPDNPFSQKFRGRLPVKHVMTLYKFVKESRVQQILHALKYKQQPELGEMLGRIYGQDLLEANFKNSFDLIIPVPLHAARRRIRGYNQSDEFGKGLSRVLHVPCDDTYMVRKAKTETQTHKTKLSRWENVNHVFQVVKSEPLVEKRVLLVDDVVTTGATLEACGQALLDAGCGGAKHCVYCGNPVTSKSVSLLHREAVPAARQVVDCILLLSNKKAPLSAGLKYFDLLN